MPFALDELRHAAPLLERLLKRAVSDERFDLRRRPMAERVLGRVCDLGEMAR